LRASPILRGSSNTATRSRKKVMMRFAVCLSSFPKSFLEASSNSIHQAKASFHFFQTVCLAAACADFNQALFGQVQIFKVVKVFADGFHHEESLVAPPSERPNAPSVA
jgi:hypothetical protein